MVQNDAFYLNSYHSSGVLMYDNSFHLNSYDSSDVLMYDNSLIPKGLTSMEVKHQIIGSGSDGTVFKSLINGNIVAIKIYKEHEITPSILREISFLSKANHPNIIKLYSVDYDIRLNVIKIIIEYGDDNLFDAVINNNDININIYDLINGLNYLHSHDYIHGDLNLKNAVLINGVVKLIDFTSATKIHRVKFYKPNPTINIKPPELFKNNTQRINFGESNIKAIDI
jgi:serine/threonine protein kinase